MPIQAFPEALKAAETATTPDEFRAVLIECADRLDAANSAIAVDSATQIMRALAASFARLNP